MNTGMTMYHNKL